MSDESFLVFEADFSVICWEPVGVEFDCNAGNLLLTLTGKFCFLSQVIYNYNIDISNFVISLLIFHNYLYIYCNVSCP